MLLYRLILVIPITILLFVSTLVLTFITIYAIDHPFPKGIHESHSILDVKSITTETAYTAGTLIISNHLGKSIDVELSQDNHTVLSTQIGFGDTLYAREKPEIYNITITPEGEGEEPIKELIDLRGCIAIVVIESPIRNQAEIHIAQCSNHLTSSIDIMDHKINNTAFPHSFEFLHQKVEE